MDMWDTPKKKMFGGLCFLIYGNMAGGVVGDDLMVRVGPDAYEEALDHPNYRVMDFTGKPTKGFVFVDQDGLESDEDLQVWLEKGCDFAASLPPK